jgi:hypothetical protein
LNVPGEARSGDALREEDASLAWFFPKPLLRGMSDQGQRKRVVEHTSAAWKIFVNFVLGLT